MKYVLVLKICSIVHLNCLPDINDSFIFNSWSECVSAGYLRSIKTMSTIDGSIIDANKMFVNFKCILTEES